MESLDHQPRTLLVANANPGRLPGSVPLDPDAQRHIRALRLRDGAIVRITNGRGALWEGRLESSPTRDGATVCRLETAIDVEPLLPVVVGFGIGAKPRTLWLTEKAVELGVGTLQPVEFSRSRSVADPARSPSFWKKARRRAEAALEQSGGAWLPELREPETLDEFLAHEGTSESNGPTEDGDRFLLTPASNVQLTDALADWTGRDRLALLVGPEGGLEPNETDDVLRHGFTPVAFGPRTLRFETAAVAAIAVVAQHAAARKPADDSE